MAPVKLMVNGDGTVSRRPDLALLFVQITSTSTSQTQSSTEVRLAASSVSQQFRSLHRTSASGSATSDSPIVEWSTGSLSTSFYDEHTRGENGITTSVTRKYEARLSLQARFRDFEKLSELTTTLSLAKHVSVKEVRWVLLEETRLRLERQAIEASYAATLSKAKAYARSMGRETVTPVEVRDQDTRSTGVVVGRNGVGWDGQVDYLGDGWGYRVPFELSRSRSRARGRDSEEEEGKLTLSYEPQDVVCKSSCEVTYHIS